MSKFCPNCGHEGKVDSKFCTSCGYSFEKKMAASGSDVVEVSKPATIEIDFSKVQPELKMYGGYLLSSFKKPSASFDLAPSNNGWIQFGVLSILHGLMLAILTNNPYTNTFTIFLTTTISFLMSYAVLILSVYLVNTFIKQNPLSVKTICTQLGGLFSPIVFTVGAITLFALLESSDIVSWLMVIALFLSIFGFNVYLFSTKNNNPKIDNLYITLIGNVIFIVLLYIVAYLLFEVLFEDVMRRIMYNMF